MEDRIHPSTTVSACRRVRLHSCADESGRVTVAENGNELPFAIRRVFYIYDIPEGAERGGHSHFIEEELVVAVTGRFDVKVSDGTRWQRFTLNRPDEALYVPPGLWRSLGNFAEGSMVLAMSPYDFDEADYVRDYDEFLKLRGIEV